jgi:choline dehydrogenase
MSAGNAAAFLGLPVIAPEKYQTLANRYENQDPAVFLPSNSADTVVAGYKMQQAAMVKGMRSPGTAFLEFMMTGQGGGLVMSMHPASRGTVNIDPEDPDALDPLVDYRALTNPIDLRILIELIRGVRRYFGSPGMEQLSPVEDLPGPDVKTDEELAQYIRENMSPTIFHPVGTAAKMPKELGGVVGEDLLVHGVEKLSVIDASVIPLIPGSVTSSTVYAIAEKVSQSRRVDVESAMSS